MYKYIGSYFPLKMRKRVKELLLYAGMTVDVKSYLGFIFLFDFSLSFILALFFMLFFKINYLLSFIVIFFLVDAISYMSLHFKADAKARFVEKVLPDVLRLMAGNLKAGITTDKAFILSARPEFGIFKKEIIKIGKEIATGKDMGESLMDVTKRVRSAKLKNVFELIVSGLKTGGQLSDLLEQTAQDLTNQKIIERKIRSNVKLYVIFISIAITIAAPIMYALSIFLAEVLTQQMVAIDLGALASSVPFAIDGSLDLVPITRFVLISILTTVFFGSLVLGQISKGDEKEGLHHIPLLVVSSLSLFFLVLWLLRKLLGTLLL